MKHPLLLLTLSSILPHSSLAAVWVVGPDSDIIIGSTFEGLFIAFGNDLTTNNVSEATVTTSSETYSVNVSSENPADWDINFFFSGMGIENSEAFSFVRTAAGGPVANLTPGTVIGSSIMHDLGLSGAADSSSIVIAPDLSISGGPPGDSFAHIGTDFHQFVSGEVGYLGFAWDPEKTGTPIYGYFEVTFNDDGTPGAIHSWSFEDNPGAGITVVPEPRSGLMILITLASGLCLMRQR